MNLKALILLFCLTFFCWSTYSQDVVKFQQLRGENVPTQSITYAIDQDSSGNIWIASEEGVLKHNSQFYTIYNSYKGLPPNTNNRIKEVFVDSKNQVWIGTEKGVCLYNKDLDVFEFVNQKDDLNPALVNTIIEDENNVIWVGAFNGLWRCDSNKKSQIITRIVSDLNIQALNYHNNKLVVGSKKGLFYLNDKGDALQEIPVALSNKNINCISKINNTLLVGTKYGDLLKLNGSLNNTSLIQLDSDFNKPIMDIIENTDNSILVATDGNGIYKLNTDFKTINHFTEDVNNNYSLSSNGVYDICIDRENMLWVATYGGGVNFYNSNQLPVVNIQHEINNNNTIATSFTRAIEEDNTGKLWFGTKKGISIWDKKNNKWKHIKNLSNSNSNNESIVLSLQREANYIWVGTYNEGLFKINTDTYKIEAYNKANGFDIIQKIYALHLDDDGNLWAGGIEKDLTIINTKDEISAYPIQQIKSISQTANGNIIVSSKQGVYKINHQEKTFGLIEALIPDSNLSYASINHTEQTNDGKLLVATNGSGLVIYDEVKKTFKKITINEGMPSDIVQGVIPISNISYWASTTKGLANIKITANDTLIDVYEKKDGLASTEYNYGSFKTIEDTLIAFGGIDGVTLFNPKKIDEKLYKPEIVFNSFKLSNKKIEPNQSPLKTHINNTSYLDLKHNQNSLELQFTGVLHSAPSKVKYRWKLKGFDEQWSSITNNNFASYTNLSAGEYDFVVEAYNKINNVKTSRNIKIKIASPWWATNLAYLIYIVLGGLLIYTIIHFTSLIVKKRNADEQIDFFNNITHEIKTPLAILISSLDNVTENVDSKSDSKKRIKTTVKRINSLFEQMLNFQKAAADDIGLNDVSKIDVYAQIQQRITNFKPLTEDQNLEVVFNNKWTEDFHFNKESLDKILLNLISNAIKYSFRDGTISINTSKTTKGDLKIEIQDEGLGIPKDQQKYILNRYYRARNVINSQRPGTGLGLMLVKKLLEKTGGSIDFISEENKGTTFTVVLNNLKHKYIERDEVQQITTTTTQPLEETTELSEFSNSKILIVEDNDELRTLLANTLGTYFQVYEAVNGKEGLETASQIFPDIILTDLIMPEMDGMQMAKNLKENINLNHIPVFMLTVLQNSEQKLESIESGVSEYIEKPVDIKFLLAKIINTLKWQQKLRVKYVHDSDADTAELFRNKNDQEFLENLETTVITNIEDNSFSVHDLSKSVVMSRTSLYMKLKNLVDLSPQDFIIHTKLKHAKNLLIKGDLSIKEVAYNSGFSDPKYFSTSFKKFYGSTPSGFISSLKKSK